MPLIAVATGPDADSEVRIVRFPDFNHELRLTIWHNAHGISLSCLARLSASRSIQLLSFRDIGITAHVVDVSFRSSSIAPSESIVGLQLDYLIVISDSVVVVAVVHIGVTSVLKGEGAFGIESNCLIKIGDGSIIIALVCI